MENKISLSSNSNLKATYNKAVCILEILIQLEVIYYIPCV